MKSRQTELRDRYVEKGQSPSSALTGWAAWHAHGVARGGGGGVGGGWGGGVFVGWLGVEVGGVVGGCWGGVCWMVKSGVMLIGEEV